MRPLYFFTLIITALLVIGGLFYWNQYRPSTIKATCNEQALKEARQNAREDGETNGRYMQDSYDHYFERCLNANGY